LNHAASGWKNSSPRQQSSIRMYFATKKTDAKMLPTMKASFFENAY
jgi:hypothetical protein